MKRCSANNTCLIRASVASCFFFSSLLLIWPDILLSSHILKANTRTQRGEGRGVWEGVYCSLRFCAALRWWLLPLPPFLPP